MSGKEVTQFEDSSSHSLGSTLPWLVLLAGATLAVLLPIGWLVGTGRVFTAFFLVHGVVFLSAVVFSLLLTARLTKSSRILTGFSSFFFLVVLVQCARLATLPITATDALVHHLAVPKWWWKAGFIHEISWHEWSYYPMLLNLGYLGMLQMGFTSYAAFYHLGYFVILIGLVALCARSLSDDHRVTLLSAVLLISLPVFLRLATVPLVDLGLAVFSLLAVFFLARAISYRHVVSPRARVWNFLAAGAALGFAASTKLNGGLYAALFLAAIALSIGQKRIQLRHGIILALAALLVYVPWLVRNACWTGNPLYPLFKSSLGGPQLLLPGAPVGLPPLLHRMTVYGESMVEVLLLPVRIFLGGHDNDPRQFDGSLTPLLLLGLMTVAIQREWFGKVFVGGLSIVYICVAVVVSSARVRYLAPVVPSLCVFAGCGWNAFGLRFGARLRQGSLAVAVLVSLVTAGNYLFFTLPTESGRAFFAGKLSRASYLAFEIPEYELIAYVNEKLPKNSRLYLLNTSNPFFYFDREVISRGYYSANELVSWLRAGKTPQEIQAAFHELQVTHLFVHSRRLQDILVATLTADQLATWNEFSKTYLSGVVTSGDFSLWRVVSP